jgi:hypothetical protein
VLLVACPALATIIASKEAAMTTKPPHYRRLRWFQIRLRSWLVLMLVAAIAASIYGWRQRREDRLLYLINEFNAAIDRQEYERAEQISCQAVVDFPREYVAKHLREKGRLIMSIIKHEQLDDEYVCGTGSYLGASNQVETIVDEVGNISPP